MSLLTHAQCYKILNIDININISWDEFRKSYRILIQKWHPDRYEEGNEKEIATNKLKEINSAYTKLSKHYRTHGSLPRPEPTFTEAIYKKTTQQNNIYKPTPVKPDVKNDYTKKQKVHSNNQVTKNKTATIIIIIFLFITTYLLIDTEDNFDKYQEANTSTTVTTTKVDSINKKINLKKKDDNRPQANHGKFFTYGSTIGKVILTQGAPDRVEENIWYYGKSEIHFVKGKVVNWVRTVNNPLKARAIP